MQASDAPSLAQFPALAGLSAPIARRIAVAAVSRRYVRHAVLFRAGDAPAALHFVLGGRVRVARRVEGASSVLHFEDVGGVLGEIPVFGGGPYPATATAVSAVRCAVLSLDVVERLLREEPEFARFALSRLARRAHVVLQRLDELSAYTVTARLAAYLCDVANRDDAGVIELGMSQAALADQLGTAREVLVRSLRALCDAGAIRRIGRSRFALSDADALRTMGRPRGSAGLSAPR
ncbi:MAG TPA: Crp/Fnr family transcriptional regulator [Gemmatimonadaceae bacterium]|nr:Crp/Fnr family transcriptional regulator [Gemmatimonadaceae bacterium]